MFNSRTPAELTLKGQEESSATWDGDHKVLHAELGEDGLQEVWVTPDVSLCCSFL